ncbi:unnamed protein product [Moneuplotes crassus]|uniref:Uncharacterized protein n=1 Tax=Euplotes crassus TaxID=5936 RepID=A0AAD1U304_EUPCR|nr:unnamed protein product [Moneuplotes crassus]
MTRKQIKLILPLLRPSPCKRKLPINLINRLRQSLLRRQHLLLLLRQTLRMQGRMHSIPPLFLPLFLPLHLSFNPSKPFLNLLLQSFPSIYLSKVNLLLNFRLWEDSLMIPFLIIPTKNIQKYLHLQE